MVVNPMKLLRIMKLFFDKYESEGEMKIAKTVIEESVSTFRAIQSPQ